jgi:hypothetical protein
MPPNIAFTMKTTLHTLAAAAALTLAGGSAFASCGSAFCTLMTDRYAQGGGDGHIGWSADLRIESVTQSQLREGSHKINASDVPVDEEAVERRTRNTNIVTTLSYGIDADWSLSLRLPFVQRQHDHDGEADPVTGDRPAEQWKFNKVGDVQVLARRQLVIGDGATATAVFGGLKLPTGSYNVANSDGVVAERALQPGTGTTDVVIGAAARQATGPHDATIAQLSYSAALKGKEQFKPGARFEASVGWSHAYSHELGAVLQLNLRKRGRDSGAQAEPALSGSTTLDLSPGLTVGVGKASTLYGYVQLPLYQKVNGIQLVPRSSLAMGWTADF